MKTEEFKIEINAPASFVWQALWEDTNYRKWTTAFCEGSYVVSDWKKEVRSIFYPLLVTECLAQLLK